MSSLADSYAYCHAEIRKSDSDRFHTALFAREPARSSLLALYAFNLELSHAVTLTREPMLGEIRLQWWREVFDEIYAGHGREHPVVHAVMDTIIKFELPRTFFDAMIDARSFDLEDRTLATRADLRGYLRGMSGSLFALAARCLLPAQDGSLDAAARSAGEAYGGAGLLRAIAFHARRRKLFIPDDLAAETGLEAEEVFAGRMSEPLRGAILHLVGDVAQALGKARKDFKDARQPSTLPAFLPLVLVNADLSRVYEARDPFAPPSAPPPLFVRQSRILVAALSGRI